MPFQNQIQKLVSVDIPHFPPDVAAMETERSAQEKRAWAQELLDRRGEALALYRPSPFQEAFHACQAKQCLLKKGQQTGGSLALMAELARAVTGQDPHGKYPKQNGVAVILGMSLDHLGINIHPYLFETAKFKIIRDEYTHEWRPFRPWEEADMARVKQAVDAPPLIPERFIRGGYEGIKYEDRGKNNFVRVEFVNGWVLHGMGSQGVPKAGFQADLVCIDEDLERSNWYQEMMGRLLMRSGYLRWAALPYGHNDAIMNLIQLAEDEEGKPEPEATCIEATIFDNPYMPPKSRDATIKSWKQEGEDVYMMRAYARLTLGNLMYPSFAKNVHCIPRHEGCGAAYDLLMSRNGQPPVDWTRYMLVDPGHTVCGVLFVTVPPPELGDYAIAYDELYIQDCDAIKFGRLVAAKTTGQQFEAFIIDMHGARLRDIGGGELPIVQYQRQLERLEVMSNSTGSGFWPGSDKRESRENKLREWLTIREDGTAKFQVLVGFCPNLVMNFQRYKRKKDAKGVIQDEPNTRTPNHLVQCAEYGAANGLAYVRPRTRVVSKGVYDDIMEMRRHMDSLSPSARQGQFVNLGPTGIS